METQTGHESMPHQRRSRIPLSSATFFTLGLLATSANAQMPGVPVLQNAFANPGFAAAANFGSGSGSNSFGGAAAFAAASGRLQFSGGLGLFTPKNGNGRFAYGARVFAPLMGGGNTGGKFGIGVFAGIGGSGSGRSTVAATADSTTANSVTLIPVGASASYRMAIGTSHGFSVYASPIFTWYNKGGSGAGTGNVMRVSLGADVGITPSIGITLGTEFGGNAAEHTLGPRGTIFGAGLSFAFGRR